MAARRPLTVPKTGTDKAQPVVAAEAQTPMQKMLHQEKKKERTTICVNPELYKEFKMKTLANDTTVTAVLEMAMRQYLSE